MLWYVILPIDLPIADPLTHLSLVAGFALERSGGWSRQGCAYSITSETKECEASFSTSFRNVVRARLIESLGRKLAEATIKMANKSDSPDAVIEKQLLAQLDVLQNQLMVLKTSSGA